MTIPLIPTGLAALAEPANARVIVPPEFPPTLRDWLDLLRVEWSRRYQPIVEKQPDGTRRIKSTYCNIFACDAAMGWLPRVWWVNGEAERAGKIRIAYDGSETVREQNANALCKWARERGAEHGWSVSALTDVAHLVETAHWRAMIGDLCLFMAPNRNPARSGHVVVVLPPPPGYTGTSLYCAQAGRVCADPGWWSAESIAQHGPPVVLSRTWASVQSREGLVMR